MQKLQKNQTYFIHYFGFNISKSLVNANARNMAVIGVREEADTNAPIPAKI